MSGFTREFHTTIYTETMHIVYVNYSFYILFRSINIGVYRAGFAKSQEAYDVAVREVFDGLDRVDAILSKQRYLTGPAFTETDVRLFTTLIRFDSVYLTHFKVRLSAVPVLLIIECYPIT